MFRKNGNQKASKRADDIFRFQGYSVNSIEQTKNPQSHQKDTRSLNSKWSFLKFPFFSDRLNDRITMPAYFPERGHYDIHPQTSSLPQHQGADMHQGHLSGSKIQVTFHRSRVEIPLLSWWITTPKVSLRSKIAFTQAARANLGIGDWILVCLFTCSLTCGMWPVLFILAGDNCLIPSTKLRSLKNVIDQIKRNQISKSRVSVINTTSGALNAFFIHDRVKRTPKRQKLLGKES